MYIKRTFNLLNNWALFCTLLNCATWKNVDCDIFSVIVYKKIHTKEKLSKIFRQLDDESDLFLIRITAENNSQTKYLTIIWKGGPKIMHISKVKRRLRIGIIG